VVSFFTIVQEIDRDHGINSLGPFFEDDCGCPSWQWDSEASAASSNRLQHLFPAAPHAQGRLRVSSREVTAHAHLYTLRIHAWNSFPNFQLSAGAVGRQYCACAVRISWVERMRSSKELSPWCSLNRPGDALTETFVGVMLLVKSVKCQKYVF
jgi:hypothetical protein